MANKMPVPKASSYGISSAAGDAPGASGSSAPWAPAPAQDLMQAMRAGSLSSDVFANLEHQAVLMPDGQWRVHPEPLGMSPLERLENAAGITQANLEERWGWAQARMAVLGGPQFTLDPPSDLSNWAEVLSDLGVHADAAGALGRLAAVDPMGHAEATKLLAHLRKLGQARRH